MKYTAIIWGVLLFLCSACGQKTEVTSPDGRNKLMLMLDESGSLYYQIFSGGNEIVRSSLMGVVAENGKYCFDSGLVYVDQTGRTINETYTLPTGKRSEYVNKSNERTFVYKNAAGQLLKVVCRAYDDGVAFRYELGNQEPVTIRHELTECTLSDETHTWMMDWIKDYENFYPERVLDTITRPTEFLFPVLTLQDKQWMLMTEAEVYSMPAMHLSKEPKSAKIMMPMLFILLIILAGCSIALPGSGAGLEFLLKPEWDKVTTNVFLSAMGQAFFSLSLGMGCLCTYASYFKKDTNLTKTAFSVSIIDTFVAILAGLIIFPAAFSVGIQPE